MDTDARRRADVDIKNEDNDGVNLQSTTRRPTYRSWKKKYHKILAVFDDNMKTNEELILAEQKALATAKRIAIHNDRLLDLLLDVNNSGQIPPEKRFDLSLDPPSDEEALCLDLDRPSTPPSGPQPLKSYKKILREVPHITYATAAEHFPELIADLEAGRDSPADPQQGAPHPPSFLTADDIDNYLYEIDSRVFPDDPEPLPTMAPLAHPEENPPRDTARDFALRNPVSVYNWLRNNAPNTFLQDGEHHDKESAKDKEDKNGDDNHLHPPSTGGRKGATKGERAPRGSGANRNKRASAAAARAAAELFEDDEGVYDTSVATPSATAATKGKRKRVADDDPGYRPKGGSSRPTKKKRKSESGGIEGTPAAPSKRPRKSGGGDAAMKDD
ncbi:IEC3 subunit of the Ino80 complex, chromatin re-modelling-domain-containing protein [Podospora australis]|uniref:IEC3 subunit of the Ino80 complex, chromatin re-modelling-domain-containing protein n=1 Tax=Podospora australis TaxID=1536484 RepID=A0AAN7AMR9_9PEZI|nr:IEC3 subunit of the Ino80 complex, chromatin re-modelling-domain-containing protein [Podospora australis]